MKRAYLYLLIIPLIFLSYTILTQASNLAEQLKGQILLQVEEHGEAWYLSPNNNKRYFLGRPVDAFAVMREQGIGISNSDLAKIPVSLDYLSGHDSSGDGLPDDFKVALGLDVNSTDSDGDGYCDFTELSYGYDPLGPGRLNHDLDFAKSQAGRILLQVEQNGEAWYVSPENNKRYFLGRPADAFSIMRELALGIANENLRQIPLDIDELMLVCLIDNDLSLGMSSPEVLALQKYLNTTNFPVSLSGVGSKGNESNSFGSLTRQALINYQAHHNLTETGIFDQETRDSLVCF